MAFCDWQWGVDLDRLGTTEHTHTHTHTGDGGTARASTDMWALIPAAVWVQLDAPFSLVGRLRCHYVLIVRRMLCMRGIERT